MIQYKRTVLCAIVCLAGIFVLNGCSTVPKMPIKLDPNYSSRNIHTIVLMPVVDRRIDKKGKIDLENDIRVPAKRILAKKGYNVITPSTFGEGVAVSGSDVAEMNVQELSELGPRNENIILFLYVEDVLDDYVVVAYSFKIEATGSLIDKKERAELWRDKGLGANGQSGLISGPFAGMYKAGAISVCLDNIFCTLPNCAAAQYSGGVSNQASTGAMTKVVPANPVAAPAVAK